MIDEILTGIEGVINITNSFVDFLNINDIIKYIKTKTIVCKVAKSTMNFNGDQFIVIKLIIDGKKSKIKVIKKQNQKLVYKKNLIVLSQEADLRYKSVLEKIKIQYNILFHENEYNNRSFLKIRKDIINEIKS